MGLAPSPESFGRQCQIQNRRLHLLPVSGHVRLVYWPDSARKEGGEVIRDEEFVGQVQQRRHTLKRFPDGLRRDDDSLRQHYQR